MDGTGRSTVMLCGGREHRVVEQNSRDRSEQAADPSEN
jgi:hypothetical protein